MRRDRSRKLKGGSLSLESLGWYSRRRENGRYDGGEKKEETGCRGIPPRSPVLGRVGWTPRKKRKGFWSNTNMGAASHINPRNQRGYGAVAFKKRVT